MFGDCFMDLFGIDEIDLMAIGMSMIEEDEEQDFDEYWEENYGKRNDRN